MHPCLVLALRLLVLVKSYFLCYRIAIEVRMKRIKIGQVLTTYIILKFYKGQPFIFSSFHNLFIYRHNLTV